MSYERLTVKDIRTGKWERVGDPTTSAVYYINDRFGKSSLDEEVRTKRISFKEAYNRLAELEDMIESGQAVILPGKVGDKVYSINKRWLNGELYIDDRFTITAISICKNKIDLFIGIEGSDFEIEDGIPFVKGRDFLTKESAEAKLNELRGKK
jgi:hypothetical protein